MLVNYIRNIDREWEIVIVCVCVAEVRAEKQKIASCLGINGYPASAAMQMSE